MVYENKIPIEVKKPFETVYELKNEVPSYEEFMKTYENDGNLNYDDLNSGSVGEAEGYGPCWRCSVRTDCDCKSGERWCDLRVPCPSDRCMGKDRPITGWVHSRDSYTTQISNKARIRCTKHGCSVSHMSNWEFACSAHRGEFEPVSHSSFKVALFCSLECAGSDADIMWELYRYVRDNKHEWPR